MDNSTVPQIVQHPVNVNTSYRMVVDGAGHPAFIPVSSGTAIGLNITIAGTGPKTYKRESISTPVGPNITIAGTGPKTYKRESTLSFKTGALAEYEESKCLFHNTSVILIEISLIKKYIFESGKAAEKISDIFPLEMCNTDKLFERLDLTFLPKEYQRAVIEDFHSLKFKKGEKLLEFYQDLKVAYMRAKPTAP